MSSSRIRIPDPNPGSESRIRIPGLHPGSECQIPHLGPNPGSVTWAPNPGSDIIARRSCSPPLTLWIPLTSSPTPHCSSPLSFRRSDRAHVCSLPANGRSSLLRLRNAGDLHMCMDIVHVHGRCACATCIMCTCTRVSCGFHAESLSAVCCTKWLCHRPPSASRSALLTFVTRAP